MDDRITGVMVYYYFVCRRKLWYFCHDINMENENENVMIGRILDEEEVLIESDWNLKYDIINIITARHCVLIESDWNLKPYGYDKVNDEIGY